ncbi:hypothetical protein LSH36_715g01097, partial [Paralvinella palmiformis]
MVKGQKYCAIFKTAFKNFSLENKSFIHDHVTYYIQQRTSIIASIYICEHIHMCIMCIHILYIYIYIYICV